MNNELYIYIISVSFIIISFAYYIIRGKKEDSNSKNIFRFLPIISVVTFILSIFLLTNYYKNQIKLEKEKILKFENQTELNDSILLTSVGLKKTIDSLQVFQSELYLMLDKLKRQEKFIGTETDLKNAIKIKIKETKFQIEDIGEYNEILDNSIIKGQKGYISSGNTSNFIYDCPTDISSDYFDLSLQFQDKKLVEKIAYIQIIIVEIKNDKETISLFWQIYSAKEGFNKFKVKNYFRNKKSRLEIGYVLKSETKKEYPSFEKISCDFNLKTTLSLSKDSVL